MRRRTLLVTALVLVAVAAVSAWWWFGARGVREAALGWAAERRAAGWTVEWDGLALGGYPLVWRLDLTKVRIGLPGGLDLGAPRLAVRVVPWAGESVGVSAPEATAAARIGPGAAMHRLRTGALDVRIVPDEAAAGATVKLRAEAPVVTRDGADGQARARDLELEIAPASAARPEASREPLRPPPRYRARLDLFDIAISPNPLPELGPEIGRASLDAVLHGSASTGSVRDRLAKWRDTGGVVEIASLDVEWGEALLKGDATVALDERLQPLIAGTVALRGYSAALSALVAEGHVRAEDAMAARLAFRLLQAAGTAAPRIPVTLQSGILSLGPAHVARLAPIAWPDFAF